MDPVILLYQRNCPSSTLLQWRSSGVKYAAIQWIGRGTWVSQKFLGLGCFPLSLAVVDSPWNYVAGTSARTSSRPALSPLSCST